MERSQAGPTWIARRLTLSKSRRFLPCYLRLSCSELAILSIEWPQPSSPSSGASPRSSTPKSSLASPPRPKPAAPTPPQKPSSSEVHRASLSPSPAAHTLIPCRAGSEAVASDENILRLRATRLAGQGDKVLWSMQVLQKPESARISPGACGRNWAREPQSWGSDGKLILFGVGVA